MLSVIMALDIPSQFCFVYAPFQMSLYLLSVPAGEGQMEPIAERIKNDPDLLQERWEGVGVKECT